ncbi:hypothetical protein JX266_009848 [Neoarthrinium moseri]|nr:hypothetical protein JX266_009848 [Neoarthrinium moseri]
MDIATCVGLASIEAAGLSRRTAWLTVPPLKVFLGLFVLHYVIIKIYRFILYPNFVSPLRHVPGPKNLNPLLGQEYNKYTSPSPLTCSLEWSKKWPDAPFIRYLSVTGKEVLMCNSIEAYKAVLQTHCYDTIKSPFYSKLVKEISGVGLLFAEGDYHKQQRRLLVGPFSVPNMRKILPLFHDKARALAGVFDDKIDYKGFGSLEDIIGVASLGVELEELSGSGPGFSQHYHELLHPGLLGRLIWITNAFVPIRGFLPLEANRRWTNSRMQIRSMLRRQIRKRVREMDEDITQAFPNKDRDLLTYMLEEAISHKEETGEIPWTEDELIEHLVIFTVAGHETSALMLTWALYALSTDPAIQSRLRVEIMELLEKSPKPEYDDLAGLALLNNFCREVLRVYSPAMIVTRESITDLVIEGQYIPKGIQLDMPPSVMHFHPRIWGDDAHIFDPDRWENLTGDAASPYAWEPFIQGPRQCPGKNFALIEIKAILAALISRFRFIGIEKHDGSGKLMTDEEAKLGHGVKPENPSLTFSPIGGLTVRFERI